MESKILKSLGIDPAYIFLFLIMLIILMFLLYINVNMKYNRLKSSYNVFMRGQDGKTLEEILPDASDDEKLERLGRAVELPEFLMQLS